VKVIQSKARVSDSPLPAQAAEAHASGAEPEIRLNWEALAAGVGLERNEPVLVALSGGADSVLLLRLLAESPARPAIHALHFDHGLRGDESLADAEFCHALCRDLDIPLRIERGAVDRSQRGLEARARRARYHALTLEAERLGLAHILTAHHSGDRLETLIQRWVRGDVLFGLTGPNPRLNLQAFSELNPTASTLSLVRPMLELGREEIRAHLSAGEHAWREDSSNRDTRFTRNRIRTRVLPELFGTSASRALEQLGSFELAVRELGECVDASTAHLAWERRGEHGPVSARRLSRSGLVALPGPLQRAALWRLLAEATGRGSGHKLLELVLDGLEASRSERHQLPGGWCLHLRSRELVLTAPQARANSNRDTHDLPVPGELRLPDGRLLRAQLLEARDASSPKLPPTEVELDAADLATELTVRFLRPGDRFHPLGAPGSRRLCRFLADASVPREERDGVPLVFSADELIWVAGVRPAHARRIRPGTQQRVRLSLE